MNEPRSPQDHLLLKIHENHGWGDPFGFEKDPEQACDIKTMTELGMLPESYMTKPKMEFSEKPCKFISSVGPDNLPENIFDLLGVYRYTDFMEEGKIILYEVCIRDFGLMYYERSGKFMGFARQYCIDRVREIVLWHELGHWITHWMPDEAGNRWNSASYMTGSKRIEIHEGLAQLFTFYAMLHHENPEKRADYLSVFHFMLRHQAPCYHGHNIILQNRNFSWKGVFSGLQAIRKHPQANQADLRFFLDLMDRPEE